LLTTIFLSLLPRSLFQSADPLILSVGEEDEVSIGTLAETVAKAMEFKGNVVVRRQH